MSKKLDIPSMNYGWIDRLCLKFLQSAFVEISLSLSQVKLSQLLSDTTDH